MTKKTEDLTTEEIPLEALILQSKSDRYKLAYCAIRWAKEIKLKENLPDSIALLIPRSLREILTGKAFIKDIEALPPVIKVAPPSPAVPGTPSFTLNVAPSEPEEKMEKSA